MVHEDYVTYEQAEKLADLGFDYKCIACYDEEEFDYTGEYNDYNSGYYRYNLISAPTLTQAQKWLREVKGVKVYIKPLFSSEEYEYWISFKFKGFNVGNERYGVEETWEYALSSGIDEAIKLVKKEEQRNKRWYEK